MEDYVCGGAYPALEADRFLGELDAALGILELGFGAGGEDPGLARIGDHPRIVSAGIGSRAPDVNGDVEVLDRPFVLTADRKEPAARGVGVPVKLGLRTDRAVAVVGGGIVFSLPDAGFA